MGRKKAKPNKKPHTFVITPKQYEDLRDQSHDHRTTLSEQVRRAIDQYLNRIKKRRKS